MGNQMFQIAATIAHARNVGEEWSVPPSTINSNIWSTYFELPKHKFPLNLRNYNEPSFNYRPIPKITGICLNGYFQSENYFKDHAEYVVGQFFPNQDFKQNKKVSIHVRRGDYLQFSDKHPPLPMLYYESAMREFPAGTEFLVFSDDPEWCKTAFIGEQYEFMPVGEPVSDMVAMASCSGHIIANSTFSWWGAYINQQSKKIISPDYHQWFGPGNKHLNTTTLIPDSWIQVLT